MSASPFTRAPWWVTVLLGLGSAALGVFLVFRPFDSLSVLVSVVVVGCFLTGITTIAAARFRTSKWPALLAGALWLAVGVVLLAWPDITTSALATVVGIALIVGGVLDVVAGLRGSTDERLAAVISGAATIVFGVLALSWPSVTVLVVAILFGARLVLFGLRLAWSAFRDRDGARSDREQPSGPARIRRIPVCF